jgi:ribosomal protein L29
VDIAKQLAADKAQQLELSGAELTAALESRNRGRKVRKGIASILQELARSPKHGGVNFTKPELGDAMAEALLEEIRAAVGGHDEVGQRRPIVKW